MGGLNITDVFGREKVMGIRGDPKQAIGDHTTKPRVSGLLNDW